MLTRHCGFGKEKETPPVGRMLWPDIHLDGWSLTGSMFITVLFWRLLYFQENNKTLL